MFTPSGDQIDLKKRLTDIEDLRHRHEDYAKKTNIRVKMLENENAIRKADHVELVTAHKNLVQQVDLIKSALDVIKNHMMASDQLIVLMEKRLGEFLDARASLAIQIEAARKRLDESEKE